MNRIKNIFSSRTALKVMIAGVAAMLLFSGYQATNAALTYFSNTYTAQTETYQIGVSLLENDKEVARYDDDRHTLEIPEIDDNRLQLGKTYKEELRVKNCGGNLSDRDSGIDEYVRVIVRKRWLTEDGQKADTGLDPDLIKLNYVTDSWIIDPDQSTKEQTVLYYRNILKNGETSPLFTDTLTIDAEMLKEVKIETSQDGNVITTTYSYDKVKFEISAEVDAVQTHNAESAILSAWGVKVSIADDGTLSLGGGE